jgi:hypothetical protein
MKRPSLAKAVLLAAVVVLVLSVALAVVSLYPKTTGANQSTSLIDNTFNLSPNETYRQGLGSFDGGENISLSVSSNSAFQKNFSIITYNGMRFSNSTDLDVAYWFTAGADYYEAVFVSNSSNAGTVHFQVNVQEPKTVYPYSWLNESSKIIFLTSLSVVMLVLLKFVFSSSSNFKPKNFVSRLSSFGEKKRRLLLALVLLSQVFWFVLLAVNSNPLANFEGWYTDHARHTYTSSLFLKDGFSVFNTPLNQLANADNSTFKFVTWPEMPHLYPLGSILLFLPFGALLQNGFSQILIYKAEIAMFLVFAHICLFFFLNNFLKKDLVWWLKAAGIYIIYISLVIYAADGMFDSVAFLFTFFALYMFISEKYDFFFLLIAVSVFFKYQAGIFLLPLIVVGLIKIFQNSGIGGSLKNKAVLTGFGFIFASAFTGYLSAPYVVATPPQLIMNGVDAFASNAQIPWMLQSFSVLLTLAVTLVFAFYMLNKNPLLSLSAVFMLVPTFTLPYFQNWYLPFIFGYALIPMQKKELEVTIVWLIFMIAVLSFGAAAFNPLQIFANLKSLLKL